MTYDISTCKEMVSHYTAQAVNSEKPASWRALARVSLAEWQLRLERAVRS